MPHCRPMKGQLHCTLRLCTVWAKILRKLDPHFPKQGVLVEFSFLSVQELPLSESNVWQTPIILHFPTFSSLTSTLYLYSLGGLPYKMTHFIKFLPTPQGCFQRSQNVWPTPNIFLTPTYFLWKPTLYIYFLRGFPYKIALFEWKKTGISA